MACFNLTLVPPAGPNLAYILQPSLTYQISDQQAPLTQTEEISPEIKSEPLDEDSNEELEVKVKEESDSDDQKPELLPEFAKIDIPIKREPTPEPKKHKRNSNYWCDHCPYTTNWRGNLTKHVVSRHTALDEIKWLQCDHCPYKGKTKDYLKCHLLHVHNIKVKWYHCTHCSFKAKLKTQLKRHTIVNHTKSEQIQWFQCDQCTYKGKLKSNLKQHILSHHTKSSDINWFKCDHCDFRAKRKRNLKFHLINRHTDEDRIEWFECDYCYFRFKRKAGLRCHLKSVHGKGAKKNKQKTREIPVFIENKLCWRRVPVESDSEEDSFKCAQCTFEVRDKEVFTKHLLKAHTVTEIKEEDDEIVKKMYKTKDVVVIMGNIPCVKKVIEHQL